jgi:hypothetical protein
LETIVSEQAVQIIEFLGKYNKHFTEVLEYLLVKQQKVLADDMLWLLESLAEEQKFSMAGSSLENKRQEMLRDMGYFHLTSSQLLEIMPEECQGRFKMECTAMESSIDRIKQLNADILEIVEKKMDVAEEVLKSQGIAGPGFYDTAGGKVRITDPEADIIGKM